MFQVEGALSGRNRKDGGVALTCGMGADSETAGGKGQTWRILWAELRSMLLS